MARINDSDNWFDFYCADKESMIATMYSNMNADIEAGWNPHGAGITKQRQDIQEYTRDYYDKLDMFKTMDDKAVNRWCYYDLKKCGAIG